ncbi:hypothetical protein QYE76_016858 [Lolium multiflorum]|uniref:Transposase (putative) gypsy type domain-containing protein n=1 Tax=Lolium multiflorum TaxID=4521 RepID=A0AAD8QIA5_LOLMU|nr:hypothetical protein QYE76_016858 [Lolium multiflorum]
MNLLKNLGFAKKENTLRFPKEGAIHRLQSSIGSVLLTTSSESFSPHPRVSSGSLSMGFKHMLTPNSILHVSIFITLCECFLGVQPNWALWKRIFCVRRNGSHNVTYNIGGVVICVRSDVEYFDVKFPTPSKGGARDGCMYTKSSNSVENNIAPFDGGAKILRRRSWDAEATEDEKLATEALMTRIHELQNTRGKELSGIQITAYFLRIRVQPLHARKNPLWITTRRFSSSLPEGGEVEERTIVDEDPQVLLAPVKLRVLKNPRLPLKEAESEATASTHSLPSAVSPRNKRKRDEVTDSGTSKAEEVGPSERKTAFNPYDDALVSSGNEGTLVVSEAQADGDESSPPQQNTEHPTPPASPRAPLPKRARVEPVTEHALQLGGSTTPPLDDPLMKEFIRLGTQFVGYHDHSKKAEENLVEANKRADSLARKLEQSEKAQTQEPKIFTNLAKHFNSQEDLGLKLRQEGLKIGVEGTIALVADSQQDVDWAKVGEVRWARTSIGRACRSLCGPSLGGTRASDLGASGSLVLPVAARRWVYGNTFSTPGGTIFDINRIAIYI